MAKRNTGDDDFERLDGAYDGCRRMLERLGQALSGWQGTTRTGTEVREEPDPDHAGEEVCADGWEDVERITLNVLGKLDRHPNTEHPNVIAFMTMGT